MPHLEKDIVIKSRQGLHARPAAMFVQIASKYNSQVTVCKDEEKVSGKSIMGILTLGAQEGATIKIEVDGEDANEVLQELEALLSKEDTS